MFLNAKVKSRSSETERHKEESFSSSQFSADGLSSSPPFAITLRRRPSPFSGSHNHRQCRHSCCKSKGRKWREWLELRKMSLRRKSLSTGKSLNLLPNLILLENILLLYFEHTVPR
ncbi:hypothetical protein BUALT_Bualt13G0069600 [Buddleja alternifolia]|uniref:Uncharacterized protein n=1 Tax=Buddleja alternifolia TaxID=168488 RepID=A0AAV6WWE5_9LAMI|nr:hypothetical protein BUALT_Bualt13G0069600 [Buddleja alternifolia]